MNNLIHQALTKEDEKEEGEGKEELLQVEEIRAKESNNFGLQNNLDLKLGICSSNCSIFKESMAFSVSSTTDQTRTAFIQGMLNSGLLMTNLTSIHDPKRINGLEPWLFSDPPSGFIDPWSLAARQQKAVLEQAHKKTSNPSSATSQILPRETQPPPPSAVGWPPVCAFRRNILSSQTAKPEMEDEREAKRARIGEAEAFNGFVEDAKGAMFVKVNMEGYAVGRKIDLKAHVSYDSLSDSLKKMFKNFLSLDDYSISEEQKGEISNRDFILLYEDHEGDRMLVGDVPWEMFLTSVKRLYIVRSPKSQASAEVRRISPGNMDAIQYEN